MPDVAYKVNKSELTQRKPRNVLCHAHYVVHKCGRSV